jgi:hypothetical protein
VPDNVTVAALSLIVNAKFTVLLTTEEIDAATKKTATYRPPGQQPAASAAEHQFAADTRSTTACTPEE